MSEFLGRAGATEFDGAVAVVTGGASGLGAAAAAMLHARGAQIAVLDRSILGVPSHYFSATCDIADSLQVNAAVESVAAESVRSTS